MRVRSPSGPMVDFDEDEMAVYHERGFDAAWSQKMRKYTGRMIRLDTQEGLELTPNQKAFLEANGK